MSFPVGDEVQVGRFMWVENHIGFDRDAVHGHGLRKGGSIDTDCTVEVRGTYEDKVVLKLNRGSMPFGAQAAIGTVFCVSMSEFDSWPKLIEKEDASSHRVSCLAEVFCK